MGTIVFGLREPRNFIHPAEDWAPSQNTVPDFRVRIHEGKGYVGNTFISTFNLVSDAIPKPTANPRIDILGFNSAGALVRVQGTESPFPSFPSLPNTPFHPVVAVLMTPTMSFITDNDLLDLRGVFIIAEAAALNHNSLQGRSDSDAHPISAITGLSATLAGKVDTATFTAALAAKADQDGTDEAIFEINKDGGVLTTNPKLRVDLTGNLGGTRSIQYNISAARWEIENAAGVFIPIPTGTAAGIDVLTVDGVDVSDNSAGKLFLESQDDLSLDLVPDAPANKVKFAARRILLFSDQATVPASSFVDILSGFYRVPTGRKIQKILLQARNPALGIDDFTTPPDPDRRVKVFIAHAAGGPVVDFFTTAETDAVIDLGINTLVAGDRIGMVMENINSSMAKDIAGNVVLFEQPA